MKESERLEWKEMNQKETNYFESLSEKEQASFILNKNPVLKFRKPVSRCEKDSWPNGYWCYQLSNGWLTCRSSSQEETKSLFKSKTEVQ